MTAGSLIFSVSSPPSTSRVTSAASPSITTFEAKVACGQHMSAANIWPVWLQSSSIACLPRMMKIGFSASTTALSSLATASGSIACPSGVSIKRPRSAPIDRAVRMVSCDLLGPMETATTSWTMPFSFIRTTSSTAISSKGFIDILTFESSTPEPSVLTRIFTLKSTTRLTATRAFIPPGAPSGHDLDFPATSCRTAVAGPAAKGQICLICGDANWRFADARWKPRAPNSACQLGSSADTLDNGKATRPVADPPRSPRCRVGPRAPGSDRAQVAVEQWHARAPQEHDQDGARRQSADVGPPGDLIDRAD